MKRFRLLCVTAAIILALPVLVSAAWKRVELASGASVCQDEATGTQFKPPYAAKADVTKACNTLTAFLPWLGTADAASVVRNVGFLVRTPDGRYDESCPTGDCAPTTVAWNTTALAAAMSLVSNQTTGTPTDINLAAYCTGINCASAAYAIHTAVANWSITSVSHLTHAGVATGNSSSAGALLLDVCYPSSPTCNTSTSFNWSYTAPAVMDTTAPNPVTNLQSPSVGTLVVNLTHNVTIDPNDAVTRTGIASYCYKRNGTLVGSCDAAVSAGLVNDWTGGNIGSPMGSLSCTQSGATWTIVGGGAGIEQNASDSAYACKAPVSGSNVDLIVKVASGGFTAGNYNKLFIELVAQDTISAISAEATLLHTASGYFVEVCNRQVDGASRHCIFSSFIDTSLVPYLWLHFDTNGLDVSHSTDGTTFIPDVVNIAVPLPDSKIARVGATTTSDGTTVSIPLDWITLSVSPTVNKALTTVAGAATFTVTAKDTAGNESSALAGVSATVPGGSPSTAKKWHPGYCVDSWRDDAHFTNQPTRFAEYDQEASNTHIKCWVYWYPWAQLEGATHGDYTAGKALIHAEITKLSGLASPKRLIIAMLDEPNYSIIGSQAAQAAFFPTYIQNAGCLVSGLDNSGGRITHFNDWNATCRQYLLDFIAAYGAEFDSDPYFEGFGYPYERIIQGCCQSGGYSSAAYDAASRAIADAMATAFPHTNVWMTLNFYLAQADIISLVSYLESRGVGWGNGDSCPVAVKTYPSNQVTRGDIGGHDYRGEAFLIWKVEATELGFGSLCGGTAGISSANLYTHWNTEVAAQYGLMERNVFTGTNDQKFYTSGTTPGGLLTLINTTPLTHTACPTSYDSKFGNGSPGSGCNTN